MSEKELRRAFDMFDANGDGKISKEELWSVVKNLNMGVSDEEVASMLESVDENKDGLVDFNEFSSLYNDHFKKEDEDAELREAFHVFDQDKDGFITALELHSVLCGLGLRQGKNMAEIKKMIRSVDIDGDGRVDFVEFKDMMCKAIHM